MRIEAIQQMKQQMSMRLAPQIIQSIEILQLPLLDLQQEIKAQLADNPVLEEVTDTDSPAAETPSVESLAESEEKSGAEVADLNIGYDDYTDTFARHKYSGEDRKLEAMQNTAARTESLNDNLFHQFQLLDIDENTEEIGRHIIYNIDQDGYLQYPLEEVVAGMPMVVTLEKAEEVLRLVQRLEPPGVGARNIQECLLIQLGDDPVHTLERRLILEHLEDIEKNRIPKIVKETGRLIDEIKQALRLISCLNPTPGSLFSQDKAMYIVPDVIVEKIEGEYVIRLEDQFIPRLGLNREYRQMLEDKGTDKNTKEFIRQKVAGAKWLIDAIQQRQSTLMRVSRAIIDKQLDFLEDGIEHLRPLKMQSIADELGLHVSTISRAIFNKWIQTPRGIFSMKYFFTSGVSVQSAEGAETVSTRAIKEEVRKMIEGEDPKNPLSDDEIAEKLQKNGLDIARRTVTKYRKAMKIPSSRQRRKF